MCSMTDPCMHTTPAFRLIEEDFRGGSKECPTYIYYICDICWKFEFRKSVFKFKESNNQSDIYNKCTTGKSDWICESCHNSMMKNKTPMQAQLNNMELCPKFRELVRLCPIKLTLKPGFH